MTGLSDGLFCSQSGHLGAPEPGRCDADKSFEVLDKVTLVIKPDLVSDVGAGFLGVFKELSRRLDPCMENDLQKGLASVGLDKMGQSIGA